MPQPRQLQLPEIETAIWQELARAPRDKHHEWRTVVLATVEAGETGEPPLADARNVVLREVDTAARTLTVFSDSRAAKVAQMQEHPQGTMVMWSRRLSWQLRLRVRLEAQADGLAAASRWARLRLSPAAQDYLAPVPPGSELRSHRDDTAAMPEPAIERGHFCVVTASLVAMDWLELHAEGHRRARFDAAGARWLTP